MKVLVVAQWIKIDGHEGGATHQSEFTKALAKLGNEVHLLCNTDKEYLGEGQNKVILHSAPKIKFRPFLSFKSMKIIEDICKKYDIDIIHKRADPGSGYSLKVARKLGIPYVAEVNYPPFSFEKKNNFYYDILRPMIQNPLRKRWMFNMLEKADVIVPVCETLSKRLRDYGLKNRIEVIYNGVDINNFRPGIKNDIKRKYNIKGDLILMVGNLGQRQGIEYLLDVAKEFPNKVFMIIGGESKYKEYTKELKEKASKNVLFAGKKTRSEVQKYLSASDICVAPYVQNKGEKHIFFPIKILEYLASGKPIITTDVIGMDELIKEGINGLMFCPQDSDDFIQKMKILEDKELRVKMGKNARETAENYSWENSGKKAMEIYKSLC